jgi:hypothetical protein
VAPSHRNFPHSCLIYIFSLQALSEPLLCYADFAAWQRAWLGSPAYQLCLDFWRCNLAGAPTMITWPTDKPRPHEPTGKGAYLCWLAPQEFADKVCACSGCKKVYNIVMCPLTVGGYVQRGHTAELFFAITQSKPVMFPCGSCMPIL